MINKDTYKRLTERRGGLVIDNCGNCSNVNNKQGCTDKNCCEIMKNRLAELEDKIIDGTLIELPYKLGTKLYFIVLHTFGGYFEIFETELWVYVSRYKDEFGGVDFAIEINDVDFDYETWVTAHCYSTRAEAEARLKELQENKK